MIAAIDQKTDEMNVLENPGRPEDLRRKQMTRRELASVLMMIGLIVWGGCSINDELGGSAVPNSRPDTRVTGRPPTLLEAGFSVDFNWTGSDADGKIVGYQWKISNNGVDGISPRDTLTIDPLTGAVINPWHFTSRNDSTFYVLADQAGFPNDPEGFQRSFRTHSFLVRAVDDKGAVDPTPSLVSFTSTTLVPTCSANFASQDGSQSAIFVPSTVNLGYTGEDLDFELLTPTHVRFLWLPANYLGEDGVLRPIRNVSVYRQYGADLIDFEDPDWTPWQRYEATEADREISFPSQPLDEHFFFCVQVRDTAGAVSIGKTYGAEVLNLRVGSQFYPGVNLFETFLGTASGSITSNLIPAGQPLNFFWFADASSYNGRIVSMRHGWDLADRDDPNDPGWAVPPGLADQNRFAEERSFSNGDHAFHLRVEDDSGNVVQYRWNISIVPFVSREHQRNLVFLDQVNDANFSSWPDENGSIYYDNQTYRDEFYEFLGRSGGIDQFDLEADFVQITESNSFGYEDLVNYKVAMVLARGAVNAQGVLSRFRPLALDDERFVFFDPYQAQGGNLFLLGNSSMEAFIQSAPYMTPVVFESPVDSYDTETESFMIGFGTKLLRDGSTIRRGLLTYPYATVGISSLDWNIPVSKNLYTRTIRGNNDRTSKCSAIKQLKLFEEFRTDHNIGPADIPNIINTHPDIDWRDPLPSAGLDTMLAIESPFYADEFVDNAISDTPYPIVPQECDPLFSYNGLCIEPMFTGIARFDWIRNEMWNLGDEDWPSSVYSDNDLRDICGEMALTDYYPEVGDPVPNGTARVTGQIYGYLSYKKVPEKPVPYADVYWGFDPYRFEHQDARKAIMWVLRDYFHLPEFVAN